MESLLIPCSQTIVCSPISFLDTKLILSPYNSCYLDLLASCVRYRYDTDNGTYYNSSRRAKDREDDGKDLLESHCSYRRVLQLIPYLWKFDLSISECSFHSDVEGLYNLTPMPKLSTAD